MSDGGRAPAGAGEDRRNEARRIGADSSRPFSHQNDHSSSDVTSLSSLSSRRSIFSFLSVDLQGLQRHPPSPLSILRRDTTLVLLLLLSVFLLSFTHHPTLQHSHPSPTSSPSASSNFVDREKDTIFSSLDAELIPNVTSPSATDAAVPVSGGLEADGTGGGLMGTLVFILVVLCCLLSVRTLRWLWGKRERWYVQWWVVWGLIGALRRGGGRREEEEGEVGFDEFDLGQVVGGEVLAREVLRLRRKVGELEERIERPGPGPY